MMDNTQILSVNEVNTHIKNLLSGDFLLRSLWIRGEISNFKHHSSGHMYFSLKDDASSIKCVMFRSYAAGLNFQPAHGMLVLAKGYVSVYERDGAYQLYVSEMITAGAGALNIAYERLKARLREEGLFEAARKKQLPYLPQKIALVTSPTSAAVRDMVSVIKRRNSKVDIIIVPAQVQGAEGATSLVGALDKAYRLGADVIITGRGGGSLEELWCFNEEKVVRKIAQSPVPIISAVGHETDFTLADFAADVRAATPSMAAEIVTPVYEQLVLALSGQKKRLYNRLNQLLLYKRQQLKTLAAQPILSRSEQFLADYQQTVDQLAQRLQECAARLSMERRRELAALGGRLDALSPLKVLNRGYAVVESAQGVVRSAAAVQAGDYLQITLCQGKVGCIVQDKEVENNGEKKINL